MFAGVQRERDPNLIRLEQNVFDLLRNIGVENDKLVGYEEKKKNNSGPLPMSLNFEDAIKELIELEKQLK
jgi:hypothetical protein